MKILVGMSHPAHFHLFRETIDILKRNNHTVGVVITPKDVLEDLLKESNTDYIKLTEQNDYKGFTGKLRKLISSSLKLDKLVCEQRPDLMIGSFTQMAWVGRRRGIPNVFFGEDDISYTFLQSLITYPFVDHIVAPEVTRVGIFTSKKIAYPGTQKLAYLHPRVFTPDASCIPEIDIKKPYAIIRLVALNAYHDVAKRGIDADMLRSIIERLNPFGNVFISSEKSLPEKFKAYRLPVDSSKIHHALAFADLFIGDSQSMTVEAALLGTPALRLNDFAKKVSILNMLEHDYGLTSGFKTGQFGKMLQKADELIRKQDIREEYEKKRSRFIEHSVDASAFFAWFVGNYPATLKILKENPRYPDKFI